MSSENFPNITVSGNAEVLVIPDKAVLRFSIDSRAKELDAAVTDNDEKIKSVVEYLKSSRNVDPSKIRTDFLNIRPLFEVVAIANDMPKPPYEDKVNPTGYVAERGLTVTLTDIDSFEETYRGLVDRGVNVVSEVSFESSELKKYQKKALIKAIRDAKEKAEMMASELGVSVAGVHMISANEHSSSGACRYRDSNIMCDPAGGGSGSGVGAGEIEIGSSVDVMFRLG